MAQRRSVGENIRAYRKARKMTQQELADRVGLTRQQIHRIETGQQGTTLERIDLIAQALNVPRAALIGGDGLYSIRLEDLPREIDPVVAAAVLRDLSPDIIRWLGSRHAPSWLQFVVRAEGEGLTPEDTALALQLYRIARDCLADKRDNPK